MIQHLEKFSDSVSVNRRSVWKIPMASPLKLSGLQGGLPQAVPRVLAVQEVYTENFPVFSLSWERIQPTFEEARD